MATRSIYHVLPHDRGWQIKGKGATRAVSLHATKAAALTAARRLGLNQAPSQIVIHKADGTIAGDETYESAEGGAARRRRSAARSAAATRKRNAAKGAAARSQAAKKAANTRRKK